MGGNLHIFFYKPYEILLYIKIYFADNRFPVIFAIYLQTAQHHQKRELILYCRGRNEYINKTECLHFSDTFLRQLSEMFGLVFQPVGDHPDAVLGRLWPGGFRQF